MIILTQRIEVAVETMMEAGEAVEEILLNNPGGKLVEVKQKVVETKEMEYIKVSIKLEFVSEKLYKKGQLV